MAYLSLYRKHRPQTFEEVIEQGSIIKTLQNAIKYDRVAHAYIFSGPRGTGKTSLARILAKTVNCLNLKKENPTPCNTCENCKTITNGEHIDVFEIDAASNTGVDNVRELIEKVNYLPAIAKYKIYIIDETHMLSTQAFNALLKTIEEPPEHVLFILATTDPQKIPVTIQSRCQRLDFIKISQAAIVGHLENILKDEKIKMSNEAIKMIAKYSGGHLRDALSISDQVIAFSEGNIELNDVINIVGTAHVESMIKIVNCLIKDELSQYFELIEGLFYKGLDPVRFVSDIIEFYRNILLLKLKLDDLLLVSDEIKKDLINIEKEYTLDQVNEIVKKLSFSLQEIRYMEDSRIYIETLLCDVLPPKSISSKVLPELEVAQETRKIVAQVEAKVVEKPAFPKRETKQEAPPVKQSTVDKPPPPKPTKEYEPVDEGGFDFVNVKHNWPNVIARLKTMKKIKLSAFLMEGMPLRMEGNIIHVGFKKDYKFHCANLQEDKNRVILDEAASSILKQKVKLSCDIIDSEDMPSDLGRDDFTHEKLINEKDIPSKVKNIAAAFEGEVVS